MSFASELKCPYYYGNVCQITGKKCRVKDRCRSMLEKWVRFQKSFSGFQIDALRWKFIMNIFAHHGGIKAWTP